MLDPIASVASATERHLVLAMNAAFEPISNDIYHFANVETNGGIFFRTLLFFLVQATKCRPTVIVQEKRLDGAWSSGGPQATVISWTKPPTRLLSKRPLTRDRAKHHKKMSPYETHLI